jgi:hypothetical protein
MSWESEANKLGLEPHLLERLGKLKTLQERVALVPNYTLAESALPPPAMRTKNSIEQRID